LHRHRADLAAVVNRSGARAIAETLLLPCPVLAPQARLATSLAALHSAALHGPALAAVAELPSTRTVPQTLLLHKTILGGESELHLAIAVLHHLPLDGPSLSAVAVLAEPEAALHSLLTATSSTAAASNRFAGSETDHQG